MDLGERVDYESIGSHGISSGLGRRSGLLFSFDLEALDRPEAKVLVKGQITLENVSFSYEPETLVLKNVDLHIKEGEAFSFVGPTGGGKSTVAKLIARFYNPR